MSDDGFSSSAHGRAMMLNPSAGTHQVTADSREVGAAGRAGDRSLMAFPYYLERYGDRGRLFALSDGAWIVTLCSNPDAVAIAAEVSWLTRVLSSRGMPSIMMEKHLGFMQAELTNAVPEKAAEYARLATARADLEAARTRILPDADFEALTEAFDRNTDPEVSTRLPHMGAIIVSAVVDEAAGVSRAVSALTDWAAGPGRFSAQWVDAVTATVAAARAKVVAKV